MPTATHNQLSRLWRTPDYQDLDAESLPSAVLIYRDLYGKWPKTVTINSKLMQLPGQVDKLNIDGFRKMTGNQIVIVFSVSPLSWEVKLD